MKVGVTELVLIQGHLKLWSRMFQEDVAQQSKLFDSGKRPMVRLYGTIDWSNEDIKCGCTNRSNSIFLKEAIAWVSLNIYYTRGR